MKFLDLFAGVGGIRLGMEQAGNECVGWVEWDGDAFARAWLDGYTVEEDK